MKEGCQKKANKLDLWFLGEEEMIFKCKQHSEEEEEEKDLLEEMGN